MPVPSDTLLVAIAVAYRSHISQFLSFLLFVVGWCRITARFFSLLVIRMYRLICDDADRWVEPAIRKIINSKENVFAKLIHLGAIGEGQDFFLDAFCSLADGGDTIPAHFDGEYHK